VLHVLLTHQNGDFIVDSSTFTAEGTRELLIRDTGNETSDTTAVPEPARWRCWRPGPQD
jgi:hypothetical protein